MARLFDRKKKELSIEELLAAAPEEAPPVAAHTPGPYAPYVPASARTPEKQRLGAWMPAADADVTDEPDEDIEFLTALVNGETPARTESSAAADDMHTGSAPDVQMDALEVFRADHTERKAPASKALKIQPVELGDLLEDLSTVAAALRNRQAA